MSRPRLVDLYSGQGGAGHGYHLAGFDVIGIDLIDQPRYPHTFIQADVTQLTAQDLLDLGAQAVHASPPCQQHTSLRARTGKTYADHIDFTRTLLADTGLPTVMENVPGSPLARNIVLCGSMFRLGAAGRILRRHRWFETPLYMLTPPDQCAGQPVGGVYGDGGGGPQTRGYRFYSSNAKHAMGINWMTGEGLSQAIPPAYTQFIGEHLLADLEGVAA